MERRTARRLSVPFAVLLAMIEVGLKSRSGLVVRATISFARIPRTNSEQKAVRPSVPYGCERTDGKGRLVMRAALRNAIKQPFGLLSPGLVAKTLLRNNWGGGLSMKKQIPNIDVVRSAWRRVKKDIKDAIIRDLKPVKEVKGGGGVGGKSKSTTGGTGTTGSH